MNFYEIMLEDIPNIRFVFSVELNNYRNRFPTAENELEITLILEGNIVLSYENGEKMIAEPGMTSIITKSSVCRTFAEKQSVQRHITFGVIVPHKDRMISSDDLSYTDVLEIEKRVLKNKTILLPHMIPLKENALLVENIISHALTYDVSPNPADKIKCLSVWFDLCSFLTNFSLNKLRHLFFENIPSDERYIEFAIHYIEEHISENIRIEQIADWIGISQGYLQNLFKKVTGFTIIEYINSEKVKLVKKYTSERRMSLTAAAQLVGIEDSSYMSRLFKKVTGLSYKQYKTLYDNRIKS